MHRRTTSLPECAVHVSFVPSFYAVNSSSPKNEPPNRLVHSTPGSGYHFIPLFYTADGRQRGSGWGVGGVDKVLRSGWGLVRRTGLGGVGGD